MAACSLPEVPHQPPEPNYWPADAWKTATPESEGVDSSALVDMLTHLENSDSGIHSLVVVRRGYVVLDAAFYPYDGATPHDIASVTKSVTSTLLGAAIESGTLDSLDRRLVDMLGVDPADLDDPSKDDITLADVVAMRAGFDCGLSPGEPELRAMMASSDWIDFALGLPLTNPPGTRFAYCSPGFHLLSAAITEATGEPARDLATRLLFGPLGIVPGDWPTGPSGHNHGWGDLRLHPLDLAKIGFLFLHDGRWDKKRILPEGWVEDTTRSRGPTGLGTDSYGLGWWVPSGDLEGAYEARGRGGQRIVVIPALDLIIVTTGAGFEPTVIAPFLTDAVKDDGPLPENDSTRARLDAALALARQGPAAAAVVQPPAIANEVSGKVYDFAPNPFGIYAVVFDFTETKHARLELKISAAMAPSAEGRFDLGIGLDNRYRMTPVGPRDYQVGLRGAWMKTNRFELDYVEPAGANAFTMHFHFEDDRIRAMLSDKTGLYGDHELVGTRRTP
jgi:CubicO group peptidase (beta-lactamase class C family)